MPFSRSLAPASIPSPAALTEAMAGIGMRFAAAPASEPNIEDTIYFAALEGMENGDLRVLAILVTWFGTHSTWVNADRLTGLVESSSSRRACAFWAALGRWKHQDRRFARLAKAYVGDRVELLATGTAFQIERRGQDPRFAEGPLSVPANTLRDRQADVLSPAELARVHGAYRHRVMIGPSYRADMWALLDREPDLRPTELARRTYGSFATAWGVRRDFDLLKPPIQQRPTRKRLSH